MVNPLIVNYYDGTVEIWDAKYGRYVTLSFDAVKETNAVLMAGDQQVPGVVYKTAPTPPEVCKHSIPVDDICDECYKEMGLRSCEQCGEKAWDGYICHACGLKAI